MPDPAILILAFNRPQYVHQLITQLRKIKPKILYCAQDGPRRTHPEDRKLCKEVEKVWEEIDWKCEKHFLIRKKNLGCQRGVSEAITWFFKTQKSGIILEDDCIPNPTFFRYCKELLEKYKNDERVMHISGNNFQSTQKQGYRFSQYPHCWGWATWKRSWDKYDLAMSDWPHLKQQNWLHSRFSNLLSLFLWGRLFEHLYNKKVDTWDIPWVYTIWTQNGLTILPNTNLVTNIGFGANSTHTPNSKSALANIPAGSLSFPLTHPETMIRDREADAWDQLFVYEQRTLPQLFQRIKGFFV